MFDPSLIIWIVIALAACTLAWNIFALIYAKTSDAIHTKLSQEHPLLRWIFGAMESLVTIKIILLILLTGAQITRNYYLVNVGNAVPDWLFPLVVAQNVLFYGTLTLPGVFLFAFTWGLKVIDQAREDKLDESAREYLELERGELRRLRQERQQ